ncbi:lactate dehydrogenase-like 2-hydroxyacid dehydrogenase [Bradyrhizobium sp. LM2.7]
MNSANNLDVLVLGNPPPFILDGLGRAFTVHTISDAQHPDVLIHSLAPRLKAIASFSRSPVDAAQMQKLPKLEIISSFGVGYDHIDVGWAATHDITVTNTPGVLDDEVADTALGLLLCTVRELPQSERYLRAGKWPEGPYPLTKASLRDRKLGLVGMGRIGQAIFGRRLDAFGLPVVYHSRNRQTCVPYQYHPDLLEMARDVDILIVIVPGGAATKNMINARVLEALGPNGIFINMARGSVVDEPALIKALQQGIIFAAGLDVYAQEPHVPAELLAMRNVVLLPHVGSASEYTRRTMNQLVAENLLAWAAGRPPLTPVNETPCPKVHASLV